MREQYVFMNGGNEELYNTVIKTSSRLEGKMRCTLDIKEEEKTVIVREFGS